MPPLGGPRGTSEFSEECLLFVPGVSVSALSFTFRLLPGPMASVPAAHLLSHGRCPSSASLSSAWMLSTMLFLFLLLTWPLPTSPSCCRWVTLKLPTPLASLRVQSPAQAASCLRFQPWSSLFSMMNPAPVTLKNPRSLLKNMCFP